MKKHIGLSLILACMGTACGAEPEAEQVGSESQALGPIPEELAMFQPSTSNWFIDANNNGVWQNGLDTTLHNTFGGPGDIALSGSGSQGTCGSGQGEIGVWRPSTREFFLDLNGDRVWNTGVDRKINNLKAAAAGFTDQPFVWAIGLNGGEFPQCKGVVGYFRTPNAGGAGNWYIDLNDNGVIGAGEGPFQWGQKGDIAVPVSRVGGASRLTVFRSATGEWIRDTNANKVWDGCGVDSCTVFGEPGSKPFAHPSGKSIATAIGSSVFVDLNGNFAWDAGDGSYTFGDSSMQPLML